MNGLMTEREWIRQAYRRRPRPQWWGAQCLFAVKTRPDFRKDRAFWAFLLLLSLIAALLLPLMRPMPETSAVWAWQDRPVQEADRPRHVAAITYALPAGIELQPQTYTRQQLLRGKLLLLDADHGLPAGVPPPNTLSIANEGKGMIPVAGLDIKSGKETIAALGEWFGELRRHGVSGFSVCRGTMSIAQQRSRLSGQVHALLEKWPLSQALSRACDGMDWPGTGDCLQEYTVSIRSSDGQPLDGSAGGRLLLRTAWRYGFIRRYPNGEGEKANQFRYVGRVHAMAMTYLDLTMEKYLDWLHRVGVLTISEKEEVKYIIIASPMETTHIAMQLPKNAVYETSLDNMGFAIAACELNP